MEFELNVIVCIITGFLIFSGLVCNDIKRYGHVDFSTVVIAILLGVVGGFLYPISFVFFGILLLGYIITKLINYGINKVNNRLVTRTGPHYWDSP